MLAQKKDDRIRFCVGYRKLNVIKIRDVHPIQRMDKCKDSLSEAKIFRTLDCNAGYWHNAFDKEDQEKIAFVSHHGFSVSKECPLATRMRQECFSEEWVS